MHISKELNKPGK